jgi:type IV pilus assembly protein PilE
MQRAGGFTLIEMMVVMVIVAILTTIAIPSYTRYVQRGDLVEATQALSQYRVQMEQYYQDNGNYGAAAACGVAYPTLVNFALTCASANAGQTYVATATAKAGGPVTGFTYTINQLNVQATTSIPTSWGSLPANAGTSWIIR